MKISRILVAGAVAGVMMLPLSSLGAMRALPMDDQELKPVREETITVYDENVRQAQQECWAKIYSEDNFQGNTMFIQGEYEIAELRDYEQRIGSVLTGPQATLRLYGERDYHDLDYQVAPGSSRDELRGFPQGDRIESLILDCSL